MNTAECEKCGKRVVVKAGRCLLCKTPIDDSLGKSESALENKTNIENKPNIKTISIDKMGLIGGTFGLEGSVSVVDNILVICTHKGKYSFERSEIKSVISSANSEDHFGCFGFVIGAVLLGVILGLLLNILGIAIALIVSYLGSKYTSTSYQAEIRLKNDMSAIVKCSKRQITALTSLAI